MNLATITRLGRAGLPIVAILVLVAPIAATLAIAGDTLGFDFLAYHAAAVRILHGQPLYDLSFQAAGGFGLFYYPPMFAPLILPFGLLSGVVATWLWIGLLFVSFGVGVAILPVSRSIRWWMALLAGASLLLAYAIKLGQVGPILFLLFAVGWRWIGNPAAVGISAGLGTAVKLQPGILFVWAILTRRWAVLLAGATTLAVLSAVATWLAGPAAWSDFFRLLGQVTDPITTQNNASPGAAAYQLGAPAELATIIQLLVMAGVVLAVLVTAVRATAEASYLVAIVASQLLSPVLWDHYAILLLLPVAYLCSTGRWWAVLIVVLTATPLLLGAPRVVYPVSFILALIATSVAGIRAQSSWARS